MQRSIRNLLAGTAVLGGLLLSSCTSYITQEQLATLQELRKQEASLKEKLANTNSEIDKIKAELKDIQAQAKDCDSKKSFVEEKLKQWPNVWGDK
ncbi:hypothetical protein OAQ99_01695 [Candidatus Kapabacteria bacterium]|nr:hypothetical protein [Candidatus Kapabacteria bacterium]